jgi:hypothetical protein
VDPTSKINEIKKLANEQDSSIQTAHLVYDSKPLDDSKSLRDYNINTNATLHISTVSGVVTTPKRSRKRCSHKSCISAPLRGVGDCGFCQGHFCSKHRLLEQHDCIGLQNCKQQLHERNAEKLHQQQTVANKV